MGAVIEFADLSSAQAGADLAAYAAAGFDRVLIKDTEGTGYTDPYLAGWWRTAGALGLARGGYHFARPSTGNPVGEADYFLAAATAVGFGDRDWLELDCETPDPPNQGHGAYVAALVAELAARGRTSGMIYGGERWLAAAGLTAAMLPPDWRRLHLADWTATPDGALTVPPGWDASQVAARQYTDQAATPGIPGLCDRSRVLREWLPMEEDMQIADLNAVATGAGQRTWGGTVITTLAVAQTAEMRATETLTAVTPLAAEVAAIRAAMLTMIDPKHPAAAALGDPAADLLTRVKGAPLHVALAVGEAAFARIRSLLPADSAADDPAWADA